MTKSTKKTIFNITNSSTLKAILNFFYTNTLWLHWLVIWICCIMLTAESQAQNWFVFAPVFGFITLIFSPALLLSFFRDDLKKKVRKPIYYAIWALAFIEYPLFILLTDFYLNFHSLNLFYFNESIQSHDDAMYAILSIVSIVFFVLEIILQLNFIWKRPSKIVERIKKVTLEQALLLLMVVITSLTTLIGINQNLEIANFGDFIRQSPYLMWYFLQGFLMLFIYYCFYWVNHYILINNVLKKKGIVYYVLIFLFFVLVFYPIAAQLVNWLPMVRAWKVHPAENGRVFDVINFMLPFMGMLISIPFILAIQWFKQTGEIATLEKEKSETELNLLKQQINPHFFFNTLNNLYALSLKKDEATPDVILQLSELMRYVIYRGKEETVMLKEEVKYIEDYIELQEIRLFKEFDFRFTQNIEDGNLSIPPLLFIILVENSFKHGIEPAEHKCFLHIHLESDKDSLLFTCTNSYEPQTETEKGIGLENLKQRLALRFPNQHDLNIIENEGVFRVELRLNIG